MTDPYGQPYLARSSTWPVYNPYVHPPAATAYRETVVEEEDEDSDDTDDGSSTVVPTMGSAHYWSCITCWTRRSSSEDQTCDFCQSTTSTIKRWRQSKKPVEVDSDGNETHGQDVATDWICCDCGNPKLFLGGDTASEPAFESHCAECDDKTDTIYADRTPSYCCCDCRYERPHGPSHQHVNGIGLKAWIEFCQRCQEETDTIKLDEEQDERYCCLNCRGDRNVHRKTASQWCHACGRKTRTIEIDDVVDEGETSPEEVLAAVEEEEESSDEE